MKSALRLAIPVFPFLALLSGCGGGTSAQREPLGRWAWISGNDATGQAGVYGTKGTASSSNIPGARFSAMSWADHGGKLWLFGGFETTNYFVYNDLWKFDPASSAWTWVSGSNSGDEAGTYGTKGTASPSNVPGARRDAVSCTDPSGKLWLFGGNGYDSVGNSGDLNDLWKFDPATLEWIWVSGSNFAGQAGIYGTQGIADPLNVPRSRRQAISWVDRRGNLWLFGGFNTTLDGDLNDLWKYDPTTSEWTWVSGSDSPFQGGSYGTKGTPSPSNIPGARHSAVSWTDAGGNLWLFGGYGYSAPSSSGYLNDLWKFDLTTLEWTWVSGSDTSGLGGTYGTIRIPSPLNVPGTRYSAVSWTDPSGKLWLFGGVGYDSAGWPGFLNDLWTFDPTTFLWTWASGSNVINQWGLYGTKGIAYSSNVPGARLLAVAWVDSSGSFWLFGGSGHGAAGNAGDLNDLWRYTW